MDFAEILALPHVDTHTAVVTAGPDAVRRALVEVLDTSFSGRGAAGFARLVGCADRGAGGPRPLAEGSAVVGFRVAAAEPDRGLALVGRHRFSSYALVFRLDTAGTGRTRVQAQTRARFPGPAGAVYRGLVIGTGGHRIAVQRMLSAVRRRAEGGRPGRSGR
ncbi:hypothetical protein [Streptomyces sp. NPDC093094]|uniref:hypothetical protein n=1 Tax=Streptomyces sp. NPDC093094 TaxID=3366026 RepID=UPI00380E5707